MSNIKKIAVVTTTRADYGLLRRLLLLLEESPHFNLQLIVTGTHLSTKFGYTIDEIQRDNIPIAKTIEIFEQDDDISMTHTMSKVFSLFTCVFQELTPDLVILLGDRYEMFSVAATAYTLRVPIAHIHGGEVTTGALDDAYRHCITKFAHLHFVSTEPYKERVIQLGEQPQNVHHVGGMGVDAILRMNYLSKDALSEQLQISLEKPFFVITIHPCTLREDSIPMCENILEVLATQAEEYTLIFTFANADDEGMEINQLIEDFCSTHKNAHCYASLGQIGYLSLLKLADGVLGNSSSGVLETPSMNIPTLNIGDRQQGRLMASSVINTKTDKNSIREGLIQLVNWRKKNREKKVFNPYGKANAPENIMNVLNHIQWNILRKAKVFYDIENRKHDICLPDKEESNFTK